MCQRDNPDNSEIKSCVGYRTHASMVALFGVLTVGSGGLLLLISYWKPHWHLRLTSFKCQLSNAEKVLLKNNDGDIFVEEVMTEDVGQEGEESTVDYSSAEDSLINTEKKKTIKSLRYFIHRLQRFVFNWHRQMFELKTGLYNVKCVELHRWSHGLSVGEVNERRGLYGINIIDVKVKPYWQLFYEEVLDPFYIFQWASVIFWCEDAYYYYAAAILFISFVSMGISLYQTRKQLSALRDMVATCSSVTAIRNNGSVKISSDELVPGDVIVIPPNGLLMPCDAALISGTCIVNESMLTGESVPVTKTELPGKPTLSSYSDEDEPVSDMVYHPDHQKSHTLFCGTQVIQSRFYEGGHVVAVVTKTGFSTAKGSLVRSIMFPKDVGFKFFRDAIRFIAVLAVLGSLIATINWNVLLILAGIGFIYSCIRSIYYHNDAKEIVNRSLDLITTVVPPGLPAAMTVGIVYALQRLKKRNIYCISPPRVNMSGKIKLVCFDKTGTLTEDGLDLYGVIPSCNGHFHEFIPDGLAISDGPLLFAMATCHTLTYIQGELVGDPIDLKMFQATEWVIEEHGTDSSHYQQMIECEIRPRNASPVTEEMLTTSNTTFTDTGHSLAVIKRFPFSSNLQRMSVIVSSLPAQKPAVYVKGAPEMIRSLSDDKTVPDSFQDELTSLTRQGYRVLALAWKPLEVRPLRADRLTREYVESNLRFLGLLVMQNKLKPETTPVIVELMQAAVRCVMVTGDNIDTAISVARECELIHLEQRVIRVDASINETDHRLNVDYHSVTEDKMMSTGSVHEVQRSGYQTGWDRRSPQQLDMPAFVFAMTGKSFRLIQSRDPTLLNKVIVRGVVFARMSPDQKGELVQRLQNLGFCVCMCGDGANDCGALRTANAGISLSEAEASVASPFTSKIPNITCVPALIKEGRAALTTSFSVFKYMALYSMIEFVTVLMLYNLNSNLGDMQYLYVDLVVVLVIAIVMERTDAYPRLAKRRPLGSLVSFPVLFSIFSQIALQVTTLVAAYYYLLGETWFSPLVEVESKGNIVCYENTVLFSICSFLMINVSVAFAAGAPYRRPMYTNRLFLGAVIVLVCLTAYITLWPAEFVIRLLKLKVPPPFLFRVALIEIAALSFMVAIFIDHFIAPSEWLKRLWKKVRRKKEPKNKYKLVEQEIAEDLDWPPLSSFG